MYKVMGGSEGTSGSGVRSTVKGKLSRGTLPFSSAPEASVWGRWGRISSGKRPSPVCWSWGWSHTGGPPSPTPSPGSCRPCRPGKLPPTLCGHGWETVSQAQDLEDFHSTRAEQWHKCFMRPSLSVIDCSVLPSGLFSALGHARTTGQL